MAQPTIKQILEGAGQQKLKNLPFVVQALRLSTVTSFKLTDTAEHHLKKLALHEPDVLQKTLKELLVPENNAHWARCSTHIMIAMMILMSLGFAATNIYVSLKTGNMLTWKDMLIPLIGPVFIVWYDRGLLRKENKDVILALMGRSPAMTFMESVSTRIASSSKQDEYRYPSRTRHDEIDY